MRVIWLFQYMQYRWRLRKYQGTVASWLEFKYIKADQYTWKIREKIAHKGEH